MIGLSRNMANANNNLNEGAETRGLSKDKLYNRLAEEWLIPPMHSKGVSRAWLLQVWNGGVFRVGLREPQTPNPKPIPHRNPNYGEKFGGG